MRGLGAHGLAQPRQLQNRKRQTATQSTAAAGDSADAAPTKKFMGIEAFTWQKIVPLGAMFFCILFNYTILRDTKVRKGFGLDNPMIVRPDGRPYPGLVQSLTLNCCCRMCSW